MFFILLATQISCVVSCFIWCVTKPAAVVLVTGSAAPTSVRIKTAEDGHVYSFLGYKGITSADQAKAYNDGNFSPPKAVYQGAEYGGGIYITDDLNIAKEYSKGTGNSYTCGSHVCLMYTTEDTQYTFATVTKTLTDSQKRALNSKWDVIVAPLKTNKGSVGRQLLVTKKANYVHLKAYCYLASTFKNPLKSAFRYGGTNFAWTSELTKI